MNNSSYRPPTKEEIEEEKKLADEREEAHVVEAINKAIEEYSEDDGTLINTNQQATSKELSVEKYLYLEKTVSSDDTEHRANEFGFDFYKIADPSEVCGIDYGIQDLCNAIEHVTKIEYPVHFELLCKRIAPIYGNQKATSKIRREVEYGLNKMKKRVKRKGDFLYPIEHEEIIPAVHCHPSAA
jgi:hypothetical protein